MDPNALLNLRNKLKTTNTVVREMPKGNFQQDVEEEQRVPLSTPVTILYLTANWAVHQWLGPKTEIRKVLITPSKNQKEMQKKDLEEYEHIEFLEEYDSPIAEYKAFQLNEKYKFDSVH